MKLFVLPLAIAATAALMSGCAPEPLEGLSGDGGMTSNNGMGGDTGMTGGDMGMGGNNMGGFTQEFLAVHAILAPNCGQPACHGSAAATIFLLPTNVNATPAEMQAALSVQTPTTSGNRLITPSNPDASEIYVRIAKPATDPLVMPQTGPLQPDQIATIQAWIAAGAVYTQ